MEVGGLISDQVRKASTSFLVVVKLGLPAVGKGEGQFQDEEKITTGQEVQCFPPIAYLCIYLFSSVTDDVYSTASQDL